MSIFRAGRRNHGARVTADYRGYRDVEDEVLSAIEYAWSWPVAMAFTDAFGKEFGKTTMLQAGYEKGLLGSCRKYLDPVKIVLRPSMRGNEAWKTFLHELAHAITPEKEEDHGKAFQKNLEVVHTFWLQFLGKAAEGPLRDEVIRMITGYATYRGRAIGFDKDTDQRGRQRVDRPLPDSSS